MGVKGVLVFVIGLILSSPQQGTAAARSLLQTDVRVEMPLESPARREFTAALENGKAKLVGVARNPAGGETVQVDLSFRYRIPDGTIAFDEIISAIVVTVEDSDGAQFAAARVDPNSINLNPNRTSLAYRFTLYRPVTGESYFVRVRVHGNYE